MRSLLLILLIGLAWSADIDQAINQGLRALVSMQHPDGSFADINGINALAGLALLAGGHSPQRGAFHLASQRCLDQILRQQDPLTGYLGDAQGTMYSHGFATLYLAECYGMSRDEQIQSALVGALGCLLRSQNGEGGWRYDPAVGDADISVTVCCVNAIRACYNAGIGGVASQETVARALGYVRRCHNGDGSFRYRADTPPMRRAQIGPEAVPRAAAGVMSMMGGGLYALTDPTLAAGLALLRDQAIPHAHQGHYYWYGQYYAAQALFMSRRAEDFAHYWATVAPLIVSHQGPDGLWRGPDDYGPAYNTAMALLILQIPNQYLPIFQK